MWDIFEKIIVVVTIAGYCIALIKIFPKLLRWVSKRSLPLFLQMRFSKNEQVSLINKNSKKPLHSSGIRYYITTYCFHTFWISGLLGAFFFIIDLSFNTYFAAPLGTTMTVIVLLCSLWLGIDYKLDKREKSRK